MAAAQSTAKANRPEKKLGPFPGGISVAIWTNSIETENGPAKVRSITLSPRRYRDSKTGEWRDSTSYRASDLPTLIFAMQQAQEYVLTHPLKGKNSDEQEPNF